MGTPAWLFYCIGIGMGPELQVASPVDAGSVCRCLVAVSVGMSGNVRSFSVEPTVRLLYPPAHPLNTHRSHALLMQCIQGACPWRSLRAR